MSFFSLQYIKDPKAYYDGNNGRADYTAAEHDGEAGKILSYQEGAGKAPDSDIKTPGTAFIHFESTPGFFNEVERKGKFPIFLHPKQRTICKKVDVATQTLVDLNPSIVKAA